MRGVPGNKDHEGQNSAYHNPHWKKTTNKNNIAKQKAKRFAQDHSCYSALPILLITVTIYQVSTISRCISVIPFLKKKSNSKLRQFIILHVVCY